MNIRELIEPYQKIIILRHKNPDYDAYGSQFGLLYTLQNTYPEKEIIAVGDENTLNAFEPLRSSNLDYQGTLTFVLDTVAKQMLENTYFQAASHVCLIDHHQNAPDVRYDTYIHQPSASSTAEMIVDLCLKAELEIPAKAARALYFGLVGDTGRFQFSNTTAHTLAVASLLLEKGIDITEIYQRMYSEPLAMKQRKAEFFTRMKLTKKNVAYQKNDRAYLERIGLETQAVSRGMVNQMAGIEEVPIWVNFTIDLASDHIVTEIRSKQIPVVQVAKKYGGGGHNLACGCTLSSWEETDQLLNDLDQLLEEKHG